MNPDLCIDLFCGLGGWAEGFLAEDFTCIGYDVERHDYGTGGYPALLVLQDILTLHGSDCKNATIIVASPPCQEPSYRAMPWKRAKALNAAGPPHKFIELFNACFRIQREASEAAGRQIPLIVENVKGAQPWIGRARWHFGSYYLWGDVPALMPMVCNGRKSRHIPLVETPAGTGSTSWFWKNSKHEARHYGCKAEGENWSRFSKSGEVSPHWRMAAARQDGTKQGGEWWNDGGGLRQFSSNSAQRKFASAQIAKIPFPLANYIAKVYKTSARRQSSL